MTHRILITGKLHPDAISAFQANPEFTIDYHPDCSRTELLERVAQAQVLVTRSETAVDREVFDAASDLKVVARAAVGVGNIDIDYATSKGVLVLNCPGKNTNSAAELTVSLLLALLRHVPQAHVKVKGGGWDRHTFTGRELRGKSIGIVGLGNVGHRVAKFAHGFDMEVLAYDPYIAPEKFGRYGAKRCESLVDLASQVDVLSVHVPLNKETTNMVDAKVLAALPSGSWVVNAARGGVIHEGDLLKALESGHVAGAGIDTWTGEPEPPAALVAHDRVICSPHIGASTKEAQLAIGTTVVDQVEKAMSGGVVDHPVNLPEIGVIDDPMLKAYSVLAAKLGSLVGQTLDFNPVRMEMAYRGNLAGGDHSIVRLGLMKGYVGHVADGYVSFVNAQSHFDKLGIKLEEREDPSFSSYKSALKVYVYGQNGETLTVGGIVFDDRILRLSLVNDFYFEVPPEGHLVIVANNDRPGVIGDVGHYLANQGINIDSFDLSRNSKGGQAMAVIRIDTALNPEQEAAMKGIANVTEVQAASL